MTQLLDSVGATPASDFDSQGCVPAIPLRGRSGAVHAFTFVDAADYKWASQFHWNLTTTGYAYRSVSIGKGRTRKVRLHRELMGLRKGEMEVDHINRDKLDNRRSNLRVVDRSGNAQNGSSHRDARSRYRGVSPTVDGTWAAKAYHDGRQHHIGTFKTEQEAADAAACYREHHMPYATD